MKRYTYYIIFIFLSFTVIYTSCKRVKLSDADQKFAEGEYHTAGGMYREVYKGLKRNDRNKRGLVAHRMGEAYRLSNRPLRASSSYANAVRYKVSDSTLHLQYARTLHKMGNYKEAGEQYEAFLKLFPTNQFAINGLAGTRIATQWKAKPTDYKIKKMDKFASRGSEFAPALLPPDYDQVYFACNGKESKGDTISGITGAKLNDIYMSRLDENGNWMPAEHVTSEINTAGDEGGMSFDTGGTTMYYTSCPPDSTGAAMVRIYTSTRTAGSWSAATKIELNRRDTTSVFAHPSISDDGQYLYFVSDMKGGFGGKDIWRARMVGDLVEYMENLGPEINTAGDEMFPTLRNDTTLYFASDGHIGMGGLDIYTAIYRKKDKKWLIENMKYPINSFADDFGITFAGEKEEGFFSSNRNDVRDNDHIYSFVLHKTETKIEGYIVDTDDEFVAKATIRAVGRDGSNRKIQGKDTGTYAMEATRGVDYVFLANAEGYLNTKQALQVMNIEKDSTYLVDFILTPIHKPVVLENVFYEYDKASLTPETTGELDDLIDLLNVNPNVTIELSAHTDRVGSDQYNNNLSQRRAESVVSYLIKGGIAKDRMIAVGKGKTEPKTVTKAIIKRHPFFAEHEGIKLTVEFIANLLEEQQVLADEINRRTEFQVTSITYNLD